MGSVTSAFTRTRNALVKVGSEPHHDDTAAAARSSAAPDSDRVKKRSARSNVTSSQVGRQSTRQSLSEVLAPPEGDGPRPPSKSSHASAGRRRRQLLLKNNTEDQSVNIVNIAGLLMSTEFRINSFPSEA
ncbi:unnamed protein product [Arctogadus glacialis]